MTVTERAFQMSLGVTQDEGIPSEVLPNDRLAAVINARVRKSGALSKRYGYTAKPRTKLEDGNNITAGKRLIRRDDELCMTDGEFLYSFAAGLNQWVTRDRMPECQVLSRREQVGDIQAGSIFLSTVARVNTYTCVMYQRLEASGATHTWARIFRDDTLINETRLSTVVVAADLITCSNSFVVVGDDGSNDLVAWTWDTTDLTVPAWVGPTGLRNNAFVAGFFALAEITALGQFALVYRRSTGELDVYTYNTALVQQNSALNQRAGKTFVSPGARVIGTTLVIGFINTTDGNVEAMGLVASTLAGAFAAQVIGNTTEVTGPVIVGERTSLSAWILYGNTGTNAPPLTNQTGIRYRGIGVPSGAVDATTYNTYNCRHCSHIWNYGDQSYVAVKVCHTLDPDLTQDAVAVVSLGTDEVLAGDTAYRSRPVARWGEGEYFSFPQGFPTRVVAGSISGTFVGAFGLVDREFNKLATLRGAAVDVVTMSFDDTASPRWVGQTQIGGDTLIPAGMLHCYDGELCFEAGFTYYPVIVDTDTFTAVLPATGLANGTYDYVACFVKLDKQGRLWRSRPSLPVTVGVAGDPDNSIRLYITHYSITSMHDSANGFAHPVGIEVYRRQGSAPYVRLAQNVVNTSNVVGISDPTSATYFVFEDDGTWNGTNQPELYTTGGVLENNTPPPCRYSAVFNNRLFIAACDDDEVVPYSREIIHGEGAFFNIDQKIRIDDGQGVKALAVQDASLLVFKDDNDGVFFVQGNGPNDQGLENGYTEPQKIANAHGCIEPRSVLTTNMGTFFQSRRGIERIGRGEGVGLFGEPVEDTLAAYSGIITSCVYEPASGELRWSAYNGLNSQLLVFTEPTQSWARDVLFGGSGRPVIDAAMVGGVYHWLGPDGYAYTESDVYYDVNTGIPLTVGVAALFRTGDIALAGGPLGKCSYFRVALLGKLGTAAGFTVTCWTDQGQTQIAQKTFSAAEVAAMKWTPLVIPVVNHTAVQGRSIRVQVVDSPTDENGQGPIWMHLLVDYGTEVTPQRLPVPPRNRK